ncbi:MAG: phosphoenolpyruvate hydrolase family protein [Acetobacteraceae bacterium]
MQLVAYVHPLAVEGIEHRALSDGGAFGAQTALSLAESVERIDAIAEAAHALREEVIVLCHGGPIAAPEDASFVRSRVPRCHGFFAASSMERPPKERAITEQTRAFKAIRK